MTYSVVFSPEASEDLLEIYRFIAKEASPAIAQRYTDGIVSHCERFREFPERAVRRDDIRPGLHITNYKGRVVIAFAVDASQVSIIGVFYGGRDYKRSCKSTLSEPGAARRGLARLAQLFTRQGRATPCRQGADPTLVTPAAS